jgi:hypothetical protein
MKGYLSAYGLGFDLDTGTLLRHNKRVNMQLNVKI